MPREDRPVLFVGSVIGIGLIAVAAFANYGASATPYIDLINALAASAAGAVGGAIAAQRIAERDQERKALLTEIRNTNAAITLAADVFNTLAMNKIQHVQELKETWTAQREKYDAHQLRRGSPPERQLVIKMELAMLPTLYVEVDALRTHMFERLSLNGRPLGLLAALTRCSALLKDNQLLRERLIQEWIATRPHTHTEMVNFYLGVNEDVPGAIDKRYPDSIDGIYAYTDGCLFFSMKLCKDLIAHGNRLAAKWKKLYREDAPKINFVKFDKAEALALIPNEEEFKDWLAGYGTF